MDLNRRYCLAEVKRLGAWQTKVYFVSFKNEFDISYFNGPDLGTRISQAYGIKGVPETFYIAKNGELRGLKIGPLEPPELEQKINDLLADKWPQP